MTEHPLLGTVGLRGLTPPGRVINAEEEYPMPNTGNKNQGGSHEQHVKAGEQSHKNDDKNGNNNKGSGSGLGSGSGGSGSGGNNQGGSKNS